MTCWRDYPQLRDRRSLCDLLRQGLSVREICLKIGCSVSSVRTAMQHHGLEKPIVILGADIRRALEL